MGRNDVDGLNHDVLPCWNDVAGLEWRPARRIDSSSGIGV
jgi:hypothetical protein